MRSILCCERVAAQAATTHMLARVHPAADRRAAFELLVPRGWTRMAEGAPAAFAGADEVLGHAWLGGYEGPGGSTIELSTSTLAWELAPLDWLAARLVRCGWTVTAARMLEVPDGRRAELVGRRVDDATLVLGRWLAFVDAGRLLVVHTRAREQQLVRDALALELAADGFRLLAPTGIDRFEALAVHGIAPTPLAFLLPASWAVTDGSEPGTADAELVVADRRRAWLHLRVTRAAADRESLSLRSHAMRVELRQRGFVPSRVEAEILVDRARMWRACEGAIGRALVAHSRTGVAHDVRIWHRDASGHAVDAMVVAKGPMGPGVDWMRAMRALEIAFGTVA